MWLKVGLIHSSWSNVYQIQIDLTRVEIPKIIYRNKNMQKASGTNVFQNLKV